jgi:tRNA A-37 threonylcarbamoyl transferase component Bud32
VTWDLRLVEGLTETQKQVWEAASLSLRTLSSHRVPNGKGRHRETKVYLPNRVGRYDIGRILGVGGFSIVYLGHDGFTRRPAAVKIPRPHVLLSPVLRERFVREAQAAAQLDHPNIVPIYEAGIDGDLPYIAYAYCEGSTLGGWLKDAAQPMSIRQAAELVRTLAKAVEYSHERGILHRDLTPGNVLLVPRKATSRDEFPFVPKLSDFGLAKLLESEREETASSIMMGTPAYMPPEQAQRGGRTSGRKVDIYGLGAILYHALTRRAPFVGNSPWDVLSALRETEPIAPRLLRRDVPRDLETICLKCPAKEPSGRYASAGELADDLGRFLTGRPVKARPVSWWRRSWQWCRRHPAPAGLMAAVILAIGLLIGGLTLHAVRVADLNQTLAKRNDRLQEVITERDAALVERTESQALAESRETDLRHAYYVTEVGRAAAAWKRGDVRVMVTALRPFQKATAREPDLREFAWRYLWGQHAVQELYRATMPAPQWTVRFSRNGKRVAFAGADSIVRLVSTSDHAAAQEIATGQKEINGVIFGPQDEWLATAGDDGTVAVWSLPDGTRRAVWPVLENKAAYQLAYREEEFLLLVCGQSPDVHLFDFTTGEKRGVLAGGHAGVIESLSLSPDRRLLLTCGSDKTAGIWDVSERRLQRKLDGFGHYVSEGAWSSDSRRIAIGAWDHGVTVWDAASGEQLSNTTLIDAVHSIAVSSDGWILAGDAGGGRYGDSRSGGIRIGTGPSETLVVA